MQARRCDACRKYYDDPNALDPRVLHNMPAPFKLGKDEIQFEISVSILPYRMLELNKQQNIDLCPECRKKCLGALGTTLVKSFGAAALQKGESPHDGRRRSKANKPGPQAPAAGKETDPAGAGKAGRTQPRPG